MRDKRMGRRRTLYKRLLVRAIGAGFLGALAMPGMILWAPIFLIAKVQADRVKRTGPEFDTWDEVSLLDRRGQAKLTGSISGRADETSLRASYWDCRLHPLRPRHLSHLFHLDLGHPLLHVAHAAVDRGRRVVAARRDRALSPSAAGQARPPAAASDAGGPARASDGCRCAGLWAAAGRRALVPGKGEMASARRILLTPAPEKEGYVVRRRRVMLTPACRLERGP